MIPTNTYFNCFRKAGLLDYNKDYLIKMLDKDFEIFKTIQPPKKNEISSEDETCEMELDLLSIKQRYLSDLD